MTNILKKINIFFLFFFIIFFLILGTGIHSDDYTAIYQSKFSNWNDFFSWTLEKRGQNFFGIFNHYLFYWAYEIFNIDDYLIFDFFKILINYFSFILTFYFIRQYLNTPQSIIFSLFFVFSYIHDSTIFWYMSSPYIFTASMIMYSHYLINKDKILNGSLLLLFSSLLSYSSPPYIFGLSLIFLFEKKIKKFLIFNFIGFLYLSYYYYFGVLSDAEIRINNNLEIIFFLKNLVIQFFSSLDSLIGISLIIKYYSSVVYNDIVSLFLISIIIIFFYFYKNFNFDLSKNSNLFISFFAVYFLSLLMFSLTGLYAQSAFNLGNRVTIYGCLILSYFIAYFVKSRISFLLILFFILLPLFGLSNYWKDWNSDQIQIIENINNSIDLEKINEQSTLLIDKNLYVELGNINHIEFFIQPWVVRSIFNDKVRTSDFMALTQHTEISNDIVLNTKFNETIKLYKNIYIYNTSTNKLIKVSKKELLEYYGNIKFGKRHWLQLINNVYINNILLRLSPRLSLYFKND